MDIRFQAGGAENWKTDIALVPVVQGEKILETCPELDAAAPFLAIAPGMRDVSGRKNEIQIVYGHPDLPFSRVMFIGLGKEEPTPGCLREAFARGVRKAKELRLASVDVPVFCLKRFGLEERLLEEAVYACMLGNYSFTALRKVREDDPKPLDYLTIGFLDEYVPDSLRQAARRGESAAEAVMLARDLANTPANLLHPDDFADKASRETAGVPRLSCTVRDERWLEAEGFNCHLAVGRGASRPPRLVVLEYAAKGDEDADPVVFVGKGITFDSGGISIKPAAKMHTMKCDMTGAAATYAALLHLAREEVSGRFVGLLALAENMPDGGAVHPGDVVQSLAGDSVEIVNTDAEGRLVLCDALAYAQKAWKPKCLVDVATLTGACAVALGDGLAGLFSSDDRLAQTVQSVAACAGEDCWRLPLWAGYKAKLKSTCADICHTASSREGGAITAALFLGHFVKKDVAWAHLDIAGVDWRDADSPLCPAGATGFAARTLLEFARGGVE
ncbi:MAG: leucyl aminopeptidase [Desulfovibrio sp.]|nr:leucyl aminopeptidase [Desulfovibrio sp.]